MWHYLVPISRVEKLLILLNVLRFLKLSFFFYFSCRLMDMGYENDIKMIVSSIKEQIDQNKLQTILLSATLTEGTWISRVWQWKKNYITALHHSMFYLIGVQKLAGLTMNNPMIVDSCIKSRSMQLSDHLVLPSNLHQHFVCVPAKLRLVTLLAFILWKCGVSISFDNLRNATWTTRCQFRFHVDLWTLWIRVPDIKF